MTAYEIGAGSGDRCDAVEHSCASTAADRTLEYPGPSFDPRLRRVVTTVRRPRAADSRSAAGSLLILVVPTIGAISTLAPGSRLGAYEVGG